MTQPTPRPGQIWVEMDPRDERYILIVGEPATEEFTVRRVNADGSAWPKSRVLRAQLRRFNGKRGGYAIHKDL